MVSVPARFLRPVLGEDQPIVQTYAEYPLQGLIGYRFAHALEYERSQTIPYLLSVLQVIGTKKAPRLRGFSFTD